MSASRAGAGAGAGAGACTSARARAGQAVYAALDERLAAQLATAARERAGRDEAVDGDAAFQREFFTLLSPLHQSRFFTRRLLEGPAAERARWLVGKPPYAFLTGRVEEQRSRQLGASFAGFGRRNTGRSSLRTGRAQFRVAGPDAVPLRLRDGDDGRRVPDHVHAYAGLRHGDRVTLELHADPRRVGDVLRSRTVLRLQPLPVMATVGVTETLLVRNPVSVAVSANTTVVEATVRSLVPA